jgi:hypothetical protein
MIKFLDSSLTFLLALTFMFSLSVTGLMAVRQFTIQHEDAVKPSTDFSVAEKLR